MRSRVPGAFSASALARAQRTPISGLPEIGSAARKSGKPVFRGPAQESRSAIHSCRPGSRVSLRSPGTRWSRQTPHVLFSRCQTAQRYSFPRCVVALRVLVSCPFRPPRPRGGWSADRRTLLCYVARARRDDRAERNAGRPVATGTPLSALHRGDFRPGTRAAVSGSGTGADQRPARARSQRPGGRGPGPPALLVRAAIAGRHSPLRLQDRF